MYPTTLRLRGLATLIWASLVLGCGTAPDTSAPPLNDATKATVRTEILEFARHYNATLQAGDPDITPKPRG